MLRQGVVRIDCGKIRDLLLGKCRLTPRQVEERANLTHAVLHRMLGGAKRSPARHANAHVQNVEQLVRLARDVLGSAAADLTMEQFLWSGPDDLASPGANTKGVLTSAVQTHQEAMADRQLALRLYGQALCPLGSEAGLVVSRDEVLAAIDEAEHTEVPTRDGGLQSPSELCLPLLVLGEEGTGKTWAVAQWWLTRHSEDFFLFLPGPRFRGAQVATAEIVADCLRATIDPSARRDELEVWRRMIDSDDFAAAMRGRALVVLDGLNEAPETDWRTVIEAIWRITVRWGARLVLTSRPGFWARRSRDVASWNFPAPATITVEGFSPHEFRDACVSAGRDPTSIPEGLRVSLRNPRIFRLAIRLLDDLSTEAALSVDRLLHAYWEQRQRDRPELARVDPDRDVLLGGLARHAEEFHRRRIEAARLKMADLPANAVGYDLNEFRQRFPGLSRYGGLDGAAAGVLIGEIREGRFFDDDTLAPSSGYVFRKESLAFALGLYLVDEMTRLLRSQRPNLGIDNLRERLAALLEPVLDFDQTADQVMAALTVACRDPDVPDLVRAVLLDQFLGLRNREPRIKAVMAGLAAERPQPFCDAADRALDLDQPERVDGWLAAAIREAVACGAGRQSCGGWIASPTAADAAICRRVWPLCKDLERAGRGRRFAAMVLVGLELRPLADALLDWALLMMDGGVRGATAEGCTQLVETAIAWLVRLNDRDPEAISDAVSTLGNSAIASSDIAVVHAAAMLLALIAGPSDVAEAERLWPGVCGRVDLPDEPVVDIPWHLAVDAYADPSRLHTLLEEARAFGARNPDPRDAEHEAFRALAARCDRELYLTAVRDAVLALARVGSDEVGEFPEPAKSLEVLAIESASAIAVAGGVDLPRARALLATVGVAGKPTSSGADARLDQVMATFMAIAAPEGHRDLLVAAPWSPEKRGDGLERRACWRPVLPASIALDLADEALARLALDEVGGRERGLGLIEAVARHRIGPAAIGLFNPLAELIFDDAPSEVKEAVFRIVSDSDRLGLAYRIAGSGWTAAKMSQSSLRAISRLLTQELAGQIPLEELTRIVHRGDLTLAAEGVTEAELPALRRLVQGALASDGSVSVALPTPRAARRLLGVDPEWITAQLRWHTSFVSAVVDGLPPRVDPFLSVMLSSSDRPVPGGADYLLRLAEASGPFRDKSFDATVRTALAVAFLEPEVRQELLDAYVLRVTDDRILALAARAARELGPEHARMLGWYANSLCTSGRGVRMAYGVTLQALLGVEPNSVSGLDGATFLGGVSANCRLWLKANRDASHWAERRLSLGDEAAEHLALCTASKPLPGALSGHAAPEEVTPLEELFLFRFRAKAERWGGPTLFGKSRPPKWMSALGSGVPIAVRCA